MIRPVPGPALWRRAVVSGACLMSLAACGLLPQAGGSAPAAQAPEAPADQAAQEAAEPDGSVEQEGSTGLDPLEYGNCTSLDIADAEGQTPDPEDLDISNDRASAQAEVDHTVAGAETLTIPVEAEEYASVVSIGPGTRDAVIEASHLTYIIDSELETLTIRGSGNIVWVNSVRNVVFEKGTVVKHGLVELDSGYYNQVFWRDSVPLSEQDGTDSNVVARDSLAHLVASCSPAS
ncbi:hypothetical protein J5X07_04090 [Actinomyces bowdenii]|uniref:DUF3060 domain-containing protein n=1 Tax=Actinomyces bowdenii TaxID=131109 RepID=A0A3P1V565_9ACTO|nr:hypothetical protein [Actinomyces bowdenii]MBO3724215.1 hypothetical protein [Actinomyces bowdenii]RRD29271.1 hypothetical protein EII10_07090 [Actinomyces bowdenii]